MVIMRNKGWLSTHRLALLTAAALAVAAAATGCSVSSAPSDGKPQIVASMYPFAFLATSIAGDHADVATLVPPGTEPHDYELTPQQVASLRTASVVVYQAGVSAAIDEAVTEAAPAHVVETGSLIDLLPPPSGDDESIANAGDSTYGFDPHTWLDPANMVVFAAAVANTMADADPAYAGAYQAAATTLEAQLTSLDTHYRDGLAGCQRTAFLTTHAAFDYMARAYGLTQLAIAGVTPDDEPSPRRLGELADQAKTLGLTTVFFETLVSPDYAQTLASDLGLRTDVLDPIEAITKASRGGDYIAIMQANLQALQTANGCP